MKDFAKWFIDNWEKENGMVRQTEAAKLLGISKQALNSRIKSGSITTIDYSEKVRYISMKKIGLESIKKI